MQTFIVKIKVLVEEYTTYHFLPVEAENINEATDIILKYIDKPDDSLHFYTNTFEIFTIEEWVKNNKINNNL